MQEEQCFQAKVNKLMEDPQISDEQMLDLFQDYAARELMDTKTTWSIKGYRCFRDMVVQSGVHLAKVGRSFGNLWKAITGRDWALIGRKLPGRKIARTAVVSLAATDEHDQTIKDAVRVHQVLFDESAKQLMIALVHWDDDLDSPEIMSAGVQRLMK